MTATTVLSYEREIEAPPPVVWALLAEPERWSEWAPHLRSPRGLGEPQVESGRSGTVRLGGAVPVPATIVSVESGRAWEWRIGPVSLAHEVSPAPGGSLARIEIHANAPLELAFRISYGPVISLLLRNLARVAERGTS